MGNKFPSSTRYRIVFSFRQGLLLGSMITVFFLSSIHCFYIVLPADTVNGFSFHPYMPMTVTSSGHRRFIGPDNDDEDLCLSGILSNLIAIIIYSFFLPFFE